jgi:UDP-glucose 4-epimerase
MNALLLGGSGFIGKNLTEGLLNKGIGVTIFDRNCSKNDNRDIEYVIGEYKDINRYGDMFKNKDIVIHLISTTIPSNSNTDPYFDIDTNLKGSIDIISLCLEKCVDRLIYFSSGGAIYGHP